MNNRNPHGRRGNLAADARDEQTAILLELVSLDRRELTDLHTIQSELLDLGPYLSLLPAPVYQAAWRHYQTALRATQADLALQEREDQDHADALAYQRASVREQVTA